MKTSKNNSRIQSENRHTTAIAVVVTLLLVIAATIALKSVDSGIGKDVLTQNTSTVQFNGWS